LLDQREGVATDIMRCQTGKLWIHGREDLIQADGTQTLNHQLWKPEAYGMGMQGCDRIPNAEKLAAIRANIFHIWAKYEATFTYKWCSVCFPN